MPKGRGGTVVGAAREPPNPSSRASNGFRRSQSKPDFEAAANLRSTHGPLQHRGDGSPQSGFERPADCDIPSPIPGGHARTAEPLGAMAEPVSLLLSSLSGPWQSNRASVAARSRTLANGAAYRATIGKGSRTCGRLTSFLQAFGPGSVRRSPSSTLKRAAESTICAVSLTGR